jgi:hypothetical protein
MFTFKTDKPTGKYKSFSKPTHIIKLNKIWVGNINPIPPYKIGLMVTKETIMEDGNPNCTWKWIRLKKESSSLEEAKTFLNNNFQKIIDKFNIKKED